jgi:cholesterol transport system auxiliary component
MGPRIVLVGSAVFAFAFVLAGCTTSIFDSEAPVPMNYVLRSVPSSAVSQQHTAVDITIDRPDPAPGLDSDRIGVLRGHQLDYYRAVKWGSPAPEVMQALLVDSLEDQHVFRSVTREQSRVASDYILDVQLRDFQSEYSDGSAVPTIHVAAVVRMIRVPDRKLVATMTTEAKVQASDDRMSAVAAAFEKAGNEVAMDLLNKLAPTVAGDAPMLASARGQK